MSPPPQDSETKRSAQDFIFGKVIGEGSFSTVYLAKDIHTQKEFAIKVCEKKHILKEKKVEYVKREKDALNMLGSSRFFVRLFCTFQDKERLYFVLTHAKNGELLEYIKKVGSFDIICTRFYAAEILLALEILASKGIVHRDLKPENILLDENMHILITDFGSAKVPDTPALPPLSSAASTAPSKSPEPEAPASDAKKNGEAPAPRWSREKKNSFVGTAQYVSPEVLNGRPITCAADLWAFGCIIYQMVSGLPPFRAATEYLIFQKIQRLEFDFPSGFSMDARDLVKRLLVIEPTERLGATDKTPYESVRAHKIFSGVNWNDLGTPPEIHPCVVDDTGDDRPQYDKLEPGLDGEKMTRLQIESVVSSSPITTLIAAATVTQRNIADVEAVEKASKLQIQRKEKWHQFVEDNLILKQGLVDKRKGLFARRRMLLLTQGPHLYYVDPSAMVLKGEIPWTKDLRVEPKNFRVFFVHTPNRTYYLEDPQGKSHEWCRTIQEVHKHYFL